MGQPPPPTLILHGPPGLSARCTTLLQAGADFTIPAGQRLKDFLASLPGFTPDYISSRLQTMFLNGTPLDSLESTITGRSAVLAVSAAMPGLAGAILRMKSPHASLRSRAPKPAAPPQASGQVTLTLKLFNAIAKERGVDLLNKGCVLPASALHKFLAYRPHFLALIQQATLDDRAIPVHDIPAFVSHLHKVHIQIHEKK